MGLSHSDIGGYTSLPQLGEMGPVRDTELLLRWSEYSVFTPMMRTHETNKPSENAQVYDDPETLKKFGRLTRIYKELKPYIKKTVSQNTLEGTPVMRPLFLQYESDKEAFEQDYQYMFGDDLLVAPVLEPGMHLKLHSELKLRISEILCQYSGIVEILQDAKRGTAANPISSP